MRATGTFLCRALSTGIAGVVLLAGVSACGSSSSPSSGSSNPSGTVGGASSSASAQNGTEKATCPVRVLELTGVTGPGSEAGQATLAADKVTVKAINGAGGILGCPVVIHTVDTGSNPANDIPLLIKATSGTKYNAINESSYGGVIVAPTTNKAKLLTFGAFGDTGAGSGKFPYYFDSVEPFGLSDGALIKYLATVKGYKHIAVITDNTAAGQQAKDGMESGAHRSGATIVSSQAVPITTVDANAAVTATRQSNPDAVVVEIFGPAAGHVLQAISSSGWTVPVYGGVLTGDTDLPSIVSKAVWKSLQVVASRSNVAPPRSPARRLINDLKGNGVKIAATLYTYAAQVDKLRLFAWAANRAHSLDAAKIAQVLASTGTVTIPGLVNMSSTGFTSSKHYPTNQPLAIARMAPTVNGQLPEVASLAAGVSAGSQ